MTAIEEDISKMIIRDVRIACERERERGEGEGRKDECVCVRVS